MKQNKPDQSDNKNFNGKESSSMEKSLKDLDYKDFIEKFSVESADLEPDTQSPQDARIVNDKPKTGVQKKLEPIQFFEDEWVSSAFKESHLLKLIEGIEIQELDAEHIEYINEIRIEFQHAVFNAIQKSIKCEPILESDCDEIYESFLEIHEEMHQFEFEKKYSLALYLGLELFIISNFVISSVPELLPMQMDLRSALFSMPEILKKTISDKDVLLRLLWEMNKMDFAKLAIDWEEDLGSKYFKKSNWKTLRKVVDAELEIDLNYKPQSKDTFPQDIDEFQNRASRYIDISFLYSVYKKSGASEKEILDLLHSEKNKSNCELLLSSYLCELGNAKEAVATLQEGYEKNYRFKEIMSPRLLTHLFDRLIGLHFQSDQQPDALALLCERFFTNPNLLDLERIHNSCVDLNAWDQVKPFIHEFLFNGIVPQKSKAKPTTGPWPFPDPVVKPIDLEEFTYFDVIPQLLLISVFLKQTELLKQTIEKNNLLTDSNLSMTYIKLPEYPRLLEEKYPALAIKAWKHFIFYFLAHDYNSSSGLKQVMGFLNEAKKLYKAQKKQGSWEKLILEIKQNHRRKKTFINKMSTKSFNEF